jgi:tetratricopeptide (TPR) repeat protein
MAFRRLSRSLVIMMSIWLVAILPHVISYAETDEKKLIEKDLEDKYRNAIVYLSTEATDHSGTRTPKPFEGSGFIISENGHVITANHVIPIEAPDGYMKVEKTKVRIGSIEGEEFQATVIDQDPTIDLALLKIDTPPSYMRTVEIGDPRLAQKYMDIYLAGFPGGEDLFITAGKLQSLSSRYARNRWVAQLDEISGDSGGPVFSKGHVVAVTQTGYETAQKNKYLAPIILADKFLEFVKVWLPWHARESVVKKLASRDRIVTDLLKQTDDPRKSEARLKELFAIREQKNNQDNSVRAFRHRFFEIANALNDMQKYFASQDMAKALAALDEGDADPATQLLQKVAAMDESDAGEANYQLGSIAEINVDYESALSWYRLALKMPNPKAIYFDAAATMAHKLGDQSSAIQWGRESVRLREGDSGNEEPEFAVALCRIGEFVVESDPQMTVENCERALTILKRHAGWELAVAEINDNLGAAYQYRGDFPKAEEAYRKALDLSERVGALTKAVEAQKTLGNTSNNLAGLYRAMGRYRDSIPLTEKAISINEQVFGKDHPRLGIDLIGLGNIRRALGDYSESQKVFSESRKLLTSATGRNNRLVGALLGYMAPLALIQKKDDDALNFATEALDIFKKVFGDENSVFEIRVRMILAEVKATQGKLDDAHRELDRAQNIQAKYPARVDDALRITLLRASIFIRQKQFTEASGLIDEAEKLSQEVAYSNNPLIGELHLMKGKLYSENKKLNDAEKEVEKAQRLFSDSLSPQHLKRAAALKELTRIQKEMGNHDASNSTEALASRIITAHQGMRVITVIDL